LAPEYRLKWIDGSNSRECQELADLHCRLLPGSPLATLGPRFLARYYYRALPALGQVQVLASRVDGRILGFIAVTADADAFMQTALRTAPLKLAAHLGLAVLADPRRLLALREAAAISASRAEVPAGGGELLSFAVDDSVRNEQFVRSTGIRIPGELLCHAVERLQEQGVVRIRSLVDADNKSVRILYGAMGWRLESKAPRGWRRPQVEFVLDTRQLKPA